MSVIERLAFLVTTFAAGTLFGIWAQDRRWREKATSGFRMVSGGRLFTVREDKP